MLDRARHGALALAVILTAGTVPAVAAAGAAPVMEPTDCPTLLAARLPDGVTAECGRVSVPEVRGDPSSRTISLFLAVLHPGAETPPSTPIVYLEGGPGGSPTRITSLVRDIETFYGPFLAAGHDVVLLDPRGVVDSEPALDCPAFSDRYRDLYDGRLDADGPTAPILSGERMRELKVVALAACAADLRAVADLGAYHTAAMAADVADVAAALGYDRVDVWATSYGSRIAQLVMRDRPDLVRSVILDAPVPLDVDLYATTPDSYARALEELFDACAAEPACDAAYPDLPGRFADAVARLDRDPVLTEVHDPIGGRRWPVRMTGALFLEQVFRALYDTGLRPALPGIIDDAREGRFDTLLLLTQVDAMRPAFRSWGQYYTVLCHDDVPFSDRDAVDRAIARHPDLAPMFTHFEVGPLPFEVCEAWDAGVAEPGDREPIESDIPVLVTTGQFDPIVPPDWGASLERKLPRSTYVVLPGVGHGGSGTACGTELMLAFLDDPTAPLDLACVDSLAVPPFDVPVDADQPLTLVSWSSDVLGLAGAMPEGWQEVQPGVFARRRTGTDQTSLALLRVPLSEAETVRLLGERLDVAEGLQEAARREANGIAWTLYQTTTQGFTIDVAVAADDGSTIVLVLTSLPDDQPALYLGALLPVIDALVPLIATERSPVPASPGG